MLREGFNLVRMNVWTYYFTILDGGTSGGNSGNGGNSGKGQTRKVTILLGYVLCCREV